MEVPEGAGAPPSPPDAPGGWMPRPRPGGAWVPYALAALLVCGRFLPGPLGEAWAGAAERVVGSNWLDRPAVERVIGQLPGAGVLRAALLGPVGEASGAAAPDTGPGSAGNHGGGDGETVPGGDTLPALGPVDRGAAEPGGMPAGDTRRQGEPGRDGEPAAAGERPDPPGDAAGDDGGPADPEGGGTPASSTARVGGSRGGAGGGDGADGEVTGADSGRDWEPAWIWPVEGRVGEPFGWQLEDGGNPRFHDGIDIDARAGTGVRASADGIVLRVWHDAAGLGWTVEVDHRGGWVARYAGVDHVIVRDRDVVRAGQVMAAVAAEAEGRGPHLHFELRRYGQAVDPALHLPARDGGR
ncbi:MAG TPA: peptidoglycan DD-metalloendopeptidase family protein [Thermaerobacter sp.]